MCTRGGVDSQHERCCLQVPLSCFVGTRTIRDENWSGVQSLGIVVMIKNVKSKGVWNEGRPAAFTGHKIVIASA